MEYRIGVTGKRTEAARKFNATNLEYNPDKNMTKCNIHVLGRDPQMARAVQRMWQTEPEDTNDGLHEAY